MGERRKQITFDLNQALLEQNYPKGKLSLSKNYYLKAYRDIKRHMLKNGFNWIQQSVYESQEPMSLPKLIAFMEDMSQEMPWLYKSANDIVASDVISKKYNIKALLQKSAERNRSNAELSAYTMAKGCKQSLNDMITKAKTKATQNASTEEQSRGHHITKIQLER